MPNLPTPQDGTENVIPDAVPPTTDPEPEIDESEVPTGEPAAEPEVPEPQTPSVEERYRQSSSEAMILNAKNKGLESTLNKLTTADTPTEAELLAEYPDYKAMNAPTQKVMRDIVETKKRQRRQDLANIQAEAERQWQQDLRSLVRKPDYAGLRGDDKFEDFVFQPKHQGVDIQTLADAYLLRTGQKTEIQSPAPKPQSSGIPRGSGGPRAPIKPKKLTLSEASTLRNTNYKEFMRQLKAGNIQEEPSA